MAYVATTGPDVSQGVIWQVTGDGAISSSGLFTAGNSPGSATIAAISAADNSFWGSASVSVAETATPAISSDAQLAQEYIPSGQQLYTQYCAACHGADAKGDGPAASSLRTPPADLTTLSKRHQGQFPYEYVSRILLFGPGVTAHGSADMPTWGTVFFYLDKRQNEKTVQKRIRNLSDYLASLQEK